MNTKPTTVNEYIKSFPKPTQVLLKQVRAVIKEAAPEAEELIAYGMPGYNLNKSLWYILRVMKSTLGFMQPPMGMRNLQKNYLNISKEKGQCNSPLTHLCL